MTQSHTQEDQHDPFLQSLFTDAYDDLNAVEFEHQVLQETSILHRNKFLKRGLLGLCMALVAMFLQDYTLAISQVLLVTLIKLESGLAAELLVPINSVGGLLSAVLLVIRAAHNRLFC